MLSTRIPRRFVPFATVGGKPIKIMTGRVSNEPPPAMTLIVPATSPTRKRISDVVRVSGTLVYVFVCVVNETHGGMSGKLRPACAFRAKDVF